MRFYSGIWDVIRLMCNTAYLLLCAVPDRPPSSVRIIPISPWSGKVTWSRVPSSHANGIVIGYKIIAKSVNSSSYIQLISFPSTNYSGVVLGLNASTTYCFRMLAFTRIGDGNVSDCVMVTTQQHGKYYLILLADRSYYNHRNMC